MTVTIPEYPTNLSQSFEQNYWILPLWSIWLVLLTNKFGLEVNGKWKMSQFEKHLSQEHEIENDLLSEGCEMLARSYLNLDLYPIDVDCELRTQLVERVRDELDSSGCAVIKGFLTRPAIQALTDEADQAAHHAHVSHSRTNPYFTADDPSLPLDDPRRAFYDRSNGFIPADNFQKNGPLRSIHDLAGFDSFIRDCLQQKQLYRYADPLADVIVNMAGEGNGFPWHFDTNNFTVTLAIQNAESGGEFEYAPNIRRDSENFEGVKRVLAGTSPEVVRLILEPGDLQLFKGRYSLHRVAPLRGNRPRYVAIFSYVEEPNMVGSPERCKQLYGKVLPIHYERAGQRADAFID